MPTLTNTTTNFNYNAEDVSEQAFEALMAAAEVVFEELNNELNAGWDTTDNGRIQIYVTPNVVVSRAIPQFKLIEIHSDHLKPEGRSTFAGTGVSTIRDKRGPALWHAITNILSPSEQISEHLIFFPTPSTKSSLQELFPRLIIKRIYTMLWRNFINEGLGGYMQWKFRDRLDDLDPPPPWPKNVFPTLGYSPIEAAARLYWNSPIGFSRFGDARTAVDPNILVSGALSQSPNEAMTQRMGWLTAAALIQILWEAIGEDLGPDAGRDAVLQWHKGQGEFHELFGITLAEVEEAFPSTILSLA